MSKSEKEMTDTEMLDWFQIHGSHLSILSEEDENGNDIYVLEYIGVKGMLSTITGENIRNCIRKARVNMKNRKLINQKS